MELGWGQGGQQSLQEETLFPLADSGRKIGQQLVQTIEVLRGKRGRGLGGWGIWSAGKMGER
jgi:hypothetical protein